MSLGDYMRYLRAMHGGESTADIAKAIGIPTPWPINEIEQRYREVGSDELVQKLADYYGVPVEELLWRRKLSRKKLSEFLDEANKKGQKVRLFLRSGERIEGSVQWLDLGAVALALADGSGQAIVQRHIVDNWETA